MVPKAISNAKGGIKVYTEKYDFKLVLKVIS